MKGFLVEFRYRPSPASHDRPLLVFSPTLEDARERALARLAPGQRLVPDRQRTFAGPRDADNAYIGGLAAVLPPDELLECLEAYAQGREGRPQTRFDTEMARLLDQARARQRMEALEDPNSDAARAVHEARQRDAEVDRQKQERRVANLEKEREHNRERFAAKERERVIARKQAELLVDAGR